MDLVTYLFSVALDPSLVGGYRAQWAFAAFLSAGITAGALGVTFSTIAGLIRTITR